MDSSIYDRIIEETDIVALASEFTTLTKRGKNFMGLCPFHSEKTPSFSVSPEKHLAMCMGCGKGGNPITFYSQIKNISYNDAAIELASRLGINMPKTVKKAVDPNEHLYQLVEDAKAFYQFALKNTEAGLEAYEYLKQRGMTDDEINHFGIGYAPGSGDALFQMLKSKSYAVTDMMNLGLIKQGDEGDYYDVFRARITFPIDNLLGRTVGFSARTLNPKEVAKYVNSTETKLFKKGELLYHYQPSLQAAVMQKSIILHEGFFDVIASYKAGMKAAVATMGTALTTHQAAAIQRVSSHVILAYDGDKAGIEATLKAIQILQKGVKKLSVLTLPDNLDPDDYIKTFGVEAYQKLFETNLNDPYQYAYDYFKKGKDFNKATDITTFKNQMNSILGKADPTVQEFYQRKVFDELGIHLFLIQTKVSLPPKQKSIPKEIVSRAVKAELMIIIALLISNQDLVKIRKKLDMTNLVKMEHYELLSDIYNYYDHFKDASFVDINLFMKTYEKHQVLIEKEILKNIDFQKKLSQNVDDLLSIINTRNRELEIEQLKREIDQADDPDVQFRLLEQLVKLQRKK